MDWGELFTILMVICLSLLIICVVISIIVGFIKYIISKIPEKETIRKYKNKPKVLLLKYIEKLEKEKNNTNKVFNELIKKYEKTQKELDYFKDIVINKNYKNINSNYRKNMKKY